MQSIGKAILTAIPLFTCNAVLATTRRRNRWIQWW